MNNTNNNTKTNALYSIILAMIIYLVATSINSKISLNSLVANFNSSWNVYKLSRELRKSSDDLTNNARLYVATGDQIWLAKFHEILDIRNGTLIRPSGFVNEGEAISFDSLLKKYSEIEFRLLNESEKLSNKLVILENKSFHLAQKGEKSEAISLLFSDDYLTQKKSIMSPIDTFNIGAEKKFTQNISLLASSIDYGLNRILISCILLFFFTFLAFVYMYKANKKITFYNEYLEKMIKDKTLELEESRDKLVAQERLASLGALSAGIAHEIKNPLNIILNTSEFINQSINEMNFDSPNLGLTKEDFDMITESCFHLNKHCNRANLVVTNMLALARGKLEEMSVESLESIIDLNYGMVIHAKSGGTRFQIEFIKQIPSDIRMRCSRSSLSRALINIFENSIYSLNKKSKTQNFIAQINVSLYEVNDKIILSIRDNGLGVPEKLISNLMDPFFTTKPAGEGTGLGLSYVFDVMKAHGGSVKLYSKEEEFMKIDLIFNKDDKVENN